MIGFKAQGLGDDVIGDSIPREVVIQVNPLEAESFYVLSGWVLVKVEISRFDTRNGRQVGNAKPIQRAILLQNSTIKVLESSVLGAPSTIFSLWAFSPNDDWNLEQDSRANRNCIDQKMLWPLNITDVKKGILVNQLANISVHRELNIVAAKRFKVLDILTAKRCQLIRGSGDTERVEPLLKQPPNLISAILASRNGDNAIILMILLIGAQNISKYLWPVRPIVVGTAVIRVACTTYTILKPKVGFGGRIKAAAAVCNHGWIL